MAIAVDPAKVELFEEIFRRPTLERMHALSPHDFEMFVGHVFTCAGYAVDSVGTVYFPEGPGLDFNLYEDHVGGKLVGRVEVRRYAATNLIGVDAAMSVIGRLFIGGEVPGYIVTTSDFVNGAQVAAQRANGLVHLINGKHLLRYIAYVGGSRYTDQHGVRRTPRRVAPELLLEADQIKRRNPHTSRVLSVANNRGGIGKTTATLNLGFALAQQGNRVLLVDMDGQSSLTLAVPPRSEAAREPRGTPPSVHKRSIAEYFSGRATDLGQLIQPTRFDHLWLLPANADLHRMDSGGGAQPEKELAFVHALHDPKLAPPPTSEDAGGFDWILIDTPPAQSFYTRAALAASHFVLIPIEVEAFAARGIARVLDTTRAMHNLVGTGADVLGCVITCWKPLSAAHKDKLTNLQTELRTADVDLFTQAIPFDDRIDLAHLSTIGGGHKNIFGIGAAPRPSAKAYLELLRRIKEKIEYAISHSN